MQGSGFRIQGLGSGFRVQGSGFRVQGSGFRGGGHLLEGGVALHGHRLHSAVTLLRNQPTYCPICSGSTNNHCLQRTRTALQAALVRGFDRRAGGGSSRFDRFAPQVCGLGFRGHLLERGVALHLGTCFRISGLQGYLTYKKTHPPRTLPLAYV